MHSYYVGSQTVFLGGKVSPAPTFPNTTATILVTDPNGVVVESANASVEVSGAFHLSFFAGGSTLPWVQGTYTAIATYNGTSGRVTFFWYPPQVTSTNATTYTSSVTYHSEETFTSTATESAHTDSTSTTATETESSTSEPHGTMTLLTNSTAYSGSAGVLINGEVNPLPNVTNYYVAVRVIAPNGAVVYVNEVPVSSDGTFNAELCCGNGVPRQQWILVDERHLQSVRVPRGRHLWSNELPVERRNPGDYDYFLHGIYHLFDELYAGNQRPDPELLLPVGR